MVALEIEWFGQTVALDRARVIPLLQPELLVFSGFIFVGQRCRNPLIPRH